MAEYQTIKVEGEEEGIVTVTLNRPEKRNAMSPQLHYEMCEALDKLAADDDLRVMILTGAGEAFCGGQDLKEFFAANFDRPKERQRAIQATKEWGDALRTFPKATIAMVNGYTFGAGVRVMCSCDFAIASEKAIIGLSEINFGIHPGGGRPSCHQRSCPTGISCILPLPVTPSMRSQRNGGDW